MKKTYSTSGKTCREIAHEAREKLDALMLELIAAHGLAAITSKTVMSVFENEPGWVVADMEELGRIQTMKERFCGPEDKTE